MTGAVPIEVIDEWQVSFLPLALGAIQRSADRDNMAPVELLVAPLPETDGWRERLKALDDWGGDDLPNWRAIDQRLEELKGVFNRAVRPEDFRDVGRHARDLMKAAAKKAYRPQMLPAGQDELNDEAAKEQFDLILGARLVGSHNKEIRDVLRKAWDLANKVTHSAEGAPVDAFAAAQATLLVVRTLAMLDEELDHAVK
jgi:hypothetical protein